ncbi:hypothetical protein AXG93_3105s1240 [Marchantia polymorpha subsp. ruderalis]|uniref:Uncharacterized protein n=1 Tax=Marchantia polymorpha subsp. ruderalis TaxID=1480154 RepID=A0A176WLU9_MARPO|nr:hypothetical protein AXG93_3105s1240 [Marchantia polymorpha subsp. ruderalis]
MKARQLILENGSSTESSVVASQGHLTLTEWAELEAEAAGTKEDGFLKKNLQPSESRPLVAVKSSALRKDKEKVVVMEEEIQERNPSPSAEAGSLTVEHAAAKTSLEEKKKQLHESESKYEAHAAELAAKVKARKKCEAARSLELELLDRLEVNCNEMSSQQSLTEEQLSEMEVQLSEVEKKNQQLSKQTNNTLT